jgi:GT2 family glycosyltransferase/glycosyltransferase involved in cell wall biosynthesis
MKKSATTAIAAVPKFSIDGIFEDELRGSIYNMAESEMPTVHISEGTRLLGAAAVRKANDDGETAEWQFSWKLPVTLFDRQAHRLQIYCGDESTEVAFIGDPAILIETAANMGFREPIEVAHDTAMRSRVDALRKQTDTLQALLSGNAAAPGRMARRAPLDLMERYSSLLPDAIRKRPGGRDFIWFGVINYTFRIQRPQHLVQELADAGHRMFYVSINFELADEAGRFRIEQMPHHGVFLLKLRVAGQPPKNIYGGFTDAQIADIQTSLDEALTLLNVTDPIAVVQYPSWHYIAAGIPGATVVHDCLDYVGGFSNVPQEMVDLERELIKHADVVITTAQPLADHVREFRESIVVRNAADVAFFARAARFDRTLPANHRPTIGYFGAIAEWFEVRWIERCAKARPEWDFILIGQTVGANVEPLRALPNVKLLGEQPYRSLPDHLADFDVTIIPFQINDLITCTNPVKMYEYMAAGKPVVASPMPEVINATPLVYIAHDDAEFERQIAKALIEDTPALRRQRYDWAKDHTWSNRARDFMAAVTSVVPKVSVVVLAYNNWQFTNACLHSILSLTDYSNVEIIVVDNASTDGTRENLDRVFSRDPRVKIIHNAENLGFAAGNNIGMRAATGEYIILLNNDTYVTKGWIRDMIRPLMQDRTIGLVGPLTNNIGNEQKIAINYGDMQQMAQVSRRFTRRYLRRCYATHNLAFFCVATRRDVLEKVGLLDEVYGMGFFEDDDYCRRVEQAGFKIVIADDVFVHHHLSASFNALGQDEKQAQMQRNKAIYEQRWGQWRPHVYRDAPGFG